MKRLRNILLMLAGLTISLVANAQTIVTGSNLNIGSNNTLNNNRGNAIGTDHWLGGYHSLAVGNNDTIMNNANGSIAFGSLNRIGGVMSLAVGSNVKIESNYSLGLGHDLKLIGSSGCMVIGNGIIGSGANPNVSLENSYGNSLLIGFNSTKPTLTVSPSPNDYPQGDTLAKTGKVAIGDVPMPDIAAKLHIRSDYGENAGIILEPKDLTSSSTFIQMRDEYHGIWVDDNGDMKIISRSGFNYSRLLLEGKVGINVYDPDNMNPSYSLCVHGGILTDKIKIKNYSDWPDYVFNSGYPLMPLSDLKDYIYKNRHLPEVPSKKNVIEEGVEIGQMQDILLKKIEELTLYILQQQETMEELEQRIAELEEKNNNTTP